MPRIPPTAARFSARATLFALALVLALATFPDASRTAPKGAGGAAAPQTGSPQWKTQGKFDAPVNWPASTPLMIHASVLPDGRVLFWGRDKATDQFGNPTTDDVVGRSKARIWNPAANTFQVVDNSTTNLFCSGHSFLPDGRLFVAGGHKDAPWRTRAGDEKINIFNPATNSWSNGPAMEKGRWYPFTVALEDGRVAILGGSYSVGGSPSAFVTQDKPEVYNPQANTLDLLNPAEHNGFKVDIPLYPYVFLDTREGTAPDPNSSSTLPQYRGVFVAGPFRYFFWNPSGGSNGRGSWSMPQTLFQVPGNIQARHDYGTAVMYDSEEGRILLAGGMNTQAKPTRFAQTITLNQDNPAWQPTQQMQRPRTYHTSTLLPDGKVLVTGGVPCQQGLLYEPCYSDRNTNTLADINQTKDAEMWNPAVVNPDGTKGAWSLMATSQITRGYHSVALLLPDARVLVGGSGGPDGYRQSRDGFNPDGTQNIDTVARHNYAERNVELYSPPYLFDAAGNPAPRPTINSAPTQVGYGQQFNVSYGNASSISRVAWVRLPSVTHDFGTDQRINVLQYAATPGSSNQLTVTAPGNARKCPPGYYMLFIFNQDGTPSVARVVNIRSLSTNREGFIAQRAVKHNGLVHVFYRHLSDTTLRYMRQTAPDSATYTPPVDLGGGLNSNPIAVENQDGRLQVFVLGLDNAIYTRWETSPGNWANWVLLGPVSSHPIFSAARNLDGRIQVFYRGPDQALWYITQTTANGTDWARPVSLGGGLTSEPVVGMNADGRLEVFVRGTDNALHHQWQTTAGGAWSGWAALGGQLTSDPYVAHNSDGRLEVFVRGTDSGVHCIRQTTTNNSAGWTPWEALGGSLRGDHPYNRPVAAQASDGRLQVFVRWNDNTLRTTIQSAPGGGFVFNDWHNLSGWIDATLSPPVRSNNGLFHLFARGAGFNLYANQQTAANHLTWGGFTYLGDAAHSF